jgi:hypothetical protein
MSVNVGEIKGLMGEHEGLRAHMRFLIKSRERMMTQDIQVKERIWSYRCGLYDFRDAVRYHLEVDERIFKSLPSSVSLKEPSKEHDEIQRVINELIALAESTVIDKLGQEDLYQFALKIGLAFSKIYELIDAHINKENAILDEALKNV